MSLCRNTDNDPEPKDKLDSMTTSTPAATASSSLSGVAVLNGPEDEPTDWLSIDWQTVEQDVRRLRQRIFTCLLEPDAVKVASPVLRGAGRSNAPGLPDRPTSPITTVDLNDLVIYFRSLTARSGVVVEGAGLDDAAEGMVDWRRSDALRWLEASVLTPAGIRADRALGGRPRTSQRRSGR